MADRSSSSGAAQAGFTGWLRRLIGGRGGESLRETVEELLEGYEEDGERLSDTERSMLVNLLKFGELRVVRDFERGIWSTHREVICKGRPAEAHAIRREGRAALEWLGGFVSSENLDCDFRRSGRYHAAHTPRHYEALVRDAETVRKQEGIESFAVPHSEQRTELGSDVYFGGVVFTEYCSVHPAKLHRELLRIALDAGAEVVGDCAALSIEKAGTGFKVATRKGVVSARDVIVATNGYTAGLVPWIQRRVIPIGSYIIATEELPEALVDELFPTNRIACDTCKVIYYYRPSPDRRRIVFGGRVSARETDTQASTPRLYDSMCRIFPQLEGCAISHSWSGIVAYTFDELAHTGVHDGVHYALGYCGSGVSMAGYLGMRAGQKVLGLKEGATAFDDLPNPTRPFYTGSPWFLPGAVAYYRWIDDMQCRRAAKAV